MADDKAFKRGAAQAAEVDTPAGYERAMTAKAGGRAALDGLPPPPSDKELEDDYEQVFQRTVGGAAAAGDKTTRSGRPTQRPQRYRLCMRPGHRQFGFRVVD